MVQREIKVINWKQYLCCNKCWEFKEATTDNRPKNKRWQLGFWTWCKCCMSEYAKNNKEIYHKYYWEHKEHCAERSKKYRELHKEELREKRKSFYEGNKEVFAERNKKRYEKNKDTILQNQKEYYKRTRGDRLETSRKYRENNADKIKEWKIKNREKRAENRKTNEHYKEYMKKYEQENKDKILERKKNKRIEMWYWAMHLKTARTIKKLWIRPKVCPICWEEKRVEAHHPNNDIWYEIVRACNQCHQRIHNWWIECPKPINLLEQ